MTSTINSFERGFVAGVQTFFMEAALKWLNTRASNEGINTMKHKDFIIPTLSMATEAPVYSFNIKGVMKGDRKESKTSMAMEIAMLPL